MFSKPGNKVSKGGVFDKLSLTSTLDDNLDKEKNKNKEI
jgi:hypothetical protein